MYVLNPGKEIVVFYLFLVMFSLCCALLFIYIKLYKHLYFISFFFLI